MSNDLISRSALLRMMSHWKPYMDMGLVRSAVKNFPAVDAVPVVRCIECKFLGFKDFSGICNGPKVCGIVQPDSFCSWGERKDNE